VGVKSFFETIYQASQGNKGEDKNKILIAYFILAQILKK